MLPPLAVVPKDVPPDAAVYHKMELLPGTVPLSELLCPVCMVAGVAVTEEGGSRVWVTETWVVDALLHPYPLVTV